MATIPEMRLSLNRARAGLIDAVKHGKKGSTYVAFQVAHYDQVRVNTDGANTTDGMLAWVGFCNEHKLPYDHVADDYFKAPGPHGSYRYF